MARNKQRQGITLIAADTELVGDIRFRDQLIVNGHVDGNLVATDGGAATLVVSEEGSVTGEIRVPSVIINGRVDGNVYAATLLELAAGARVKGNVYYQRMEMRVGAIVDGQLLHDEALAAGNVHPLRADADSVTAEPVRNVEGA
jgi:cytoskeletal protein CcmA (bactofilin family)